VKNVLLALALALATLTADPAYAGRVSFSTEDGQTISADQRGSGEHGVVFVHAYHGDHSTWGDLPEVFQQQGANVLAIDLRGHGASRGESDPPAMVADVRAAAQYLKRRGAKKVTVVGVGLGGNLGFAAGAADELITDVVMISPRLDAQGVKVSSSLKGFGRKPLLLVTGNDDQLSIKAANMMADRIATATVEVLSAGGSGVKLLNRDSAIQGILVSWFNGAYAVASGEEKLDLQTDTEGKVETTGVKLGE
jgi:pimeloyl-ACP methyl ester carboxylesterase